MDYTTVGSMKQVMDSKESVEDTLLSFFVTRASRLLDRLCTSQPNVTDYFKAEDIADEILTNGSIDYAGRLWIYPHKPVINSVSALSYRFSLRDTWTAVDPSLLFASMEYVLADANIPYAENFFVKVSYNGGLAADVNLLPADFIDLANVTAVRLFKEERSGLGDSIGVAELGTLIYTKAFPQRVMDTLNAGSYIRTAPWM
jgi:hypothetical protein